ncbi:MAG: putative bifunctional diguanylate cyclase/phosphodiesterase [Xanthobacteraceae bacterium]
MSLGPGEMRYGLAQGQTPAFQSRERIILACLRLAPVCAAGGVLIGVAVLFGFALGWSWVWRPLPAGPATNPWTAIAFIFLGLSVLVARPWRTGPAVLLFAGLAGAIAVVRLALSSSEYLTYFHTLLLPAPLRDAILAGSARSIGMGFNTALVIGLLSASLLLPQQRHVALAQILASFASLPLVVSLIGYIYGVPGFYGAAAPPTIAGGLLCVLAVLMRSAHRAPLRQFLSLDPGGRLIRYQLFMLTSGCLLIGLVAARLEIPIDPRTLPLLAVAMLVIIVFVLGDAAYYSSRVGRWRSLRATAMNSPAARALRGAWSRGEIFLLYQPQIDLATNRLLGVEALARWQDPKRGLVAPGEFIPQAEASGLIVPLGTWVLRTACTEAARWTSGPLAHATVSVNASPMQINQPGFAELVFEVLRTSGLPPGRLILEVTESVMIQNANRGLQALRELAAAGVHIAIDDFGTGYSSLSYLRLLPSDHLKIDQSFIRELPDDQGATEITRAIVAIGKSLGMRITAEGVESPQQAEFLQSIWCDEGQGYLYAAPMAAAELALWAEQWQSRLPDAERAASETPPTEARTAYG